MSHASVVIVGAGLAGLHAARLLHRAGVPFVLLEARDRLGGRILSVDEAGRASDDGFDLGPSWFWPHAQPAIAELVAELGLPAFAQHGEGDVLFERMSREGPLRFHGDGQVPVSLRLVGGTAALVRALARDLPPEQVRLRTTVTAMTLVNDGVDLSLRRADGSPVVLRAAYVIAALTRACIDQLVRFFGEEARHPRATLLKDWAADAYTATPDDRVPSGHPVPSSAPWVSGAWRERLVLGGSETSPSEPGYLAGAVTAAGVAVREVLAAIA
jgi:monoamine oxidase